MWCGVVWCGVVWCGVVWCGVVWCGVVWCGVVWCGVVWCGVVWCGVVWWLHYGSQLYCIALELCFAPIASDANRLDPRCYRFDIWKDVVIKRLLNNRTIVQHV